MQCDHKPIMRRKQLDFVSTGGTAITNHPRATTALVAAVSAVPSALRVARSAALDPSPLAPQEGVGIKNPDVVESYFRWTVRLASGGDESHIAAQSADAVRRRDGHGVRVFERTTAADEFDAMQGQILQNALPLHFNHFALVVHEIIDRQILFQRVVDAVEATLLEPGKVESGFTQRLTGDSAGVDAAPAHILSAFDDGDAFAKIGGLRTRLLACRAAADHDEIEFFALQGHTT